MGLTDRLANPTPFDVKFRYHRGISIRVPADSSINISMEMLEDLRDGKPGSEENRKLLDYYGLFLVDPDVSYDKQALICLKATKRAKSEQHEAFVSRLRDAVFQGKHVDDETMESAIKKAGHDRLRAQVETLDKRIEFLETSLVDTEVLKPVAQFDPTRTCFGVNPPKEFPSELTLKVFLEENPSLREKHDEVKTQVLGE